MNSALATEVPALLSADAEVRGVRLAGSRARGDFRPMSDWDFIIDAADAHGVCRRLPALLSSLDPLAFVPDPLSIHVVMAVILPGPVKVDLIFEQEHAPEAPWHPSPENLAAIDAHFWDWTLWLAGKQLRGDEPLVRRELSSMYLHLLEPLGITASVHSLRDAVAAYTTARSQWEQREGIRVPRALESQVLAALRRNQLV